MLKKVEHIGFDVTDMDRSVAFYTNVLGLTLRERVRLNDTMELAFITIGDTEIELVHRAGAPASPLDGVVNHLAFTVDDIEGVLAHLKRHKVTLITEEPRTVEGLGARVAFFRGPDGEKLELFSRGGK